MKKRGDRLAQLEQENENLKKEIKKLLEQNKKKEKNIESPKNSKIKMLWISLTLITVLIFIIILCQLPLRQKNKTIYTSELMKFCPEKNNCQNEEIIKNNLTSIIPHKINKVTYSENEIVTLVTHFKKEKKFIFKIEDDLGPSIKENEITLPFEETINYQDKLTIIDYVDGKIEIDSENVKIYDSNVNINKEGKYIIKIEAKDSKGNINTKNVTVIIKKQQPEKIEINITGEYTVNKKINLEATVEPENTYDKEIIWSVNDEKIATSFFVPQNPGQYKICGTSAMNSKISSCKSITITKQCQSKYTFTLDGGTTKTYIVGQSEDICPGTYRIYVNYINNSILTDLELHYDGYNSLQLINTWGGNGEKYVLNENLRIKANAGITKITFTKAN